MWDGFGHASITKLARIQHDPWGGDADPRDTDADHRRGPTGPAQRQTHPAVDGFDGKV
jgi:hypothetical protein